MFLDSHARELIALDFFTVPTATFRILFVLIVAPGHISRLRKTRRFPGWPCH
jgi:hypothetical protein